MKNLCKISIVFIAIVLSACCVCKSGGKVNDKVDPEYGYLMHTVVKGETPRSLAKCYKCSVDEVYTLNPNMDKDPNKNLTPGQTVKLLYLKK